MNKHRHCRICFSSRASLHGFASVCLAIALVVLFASTAVFASTPQGTFERTLSVSGPVDLEVLTHSGDVTVRTGPSGSVLIRGKIFVSDRWLRGEREADVHEIEQHPPIRQEGNSIHIDYVRCARHFRGLRNHRARGHRCPHPHRLGRSDHRRHARQRRHADRIRRREAGATYRRDSTANRLRRCAGA